MTSLLRKFRINFSVVIEVTGVNRKPSQERCGGSVFTCVGGWYVIICLLLPCSLDKYHQLPQDPADNEDSKTLDKMVNHRQNVFVSQQEQLTFDLYYCVFLVLLLLDSAAHSVG